LERPTIIVNKEKPVVNNNTVFNNNITTKRAFLICLCLIFPLAPFIVAYFIITWKPNQSIKDQIRNKRTEIMTRSIWLAGIVKHCYITVGTKELEVSGEIYEKLSVGDYIEAAYRKDVLYYYTI